MRLRVGQRADVIDVTAQVTFPDQTQLLVPMTWQGDTDSWEGSVMLPPNTGSTSMVYSVKWIARDAFGQTSQTAPSTITVGPSGTKTFHILNIRAEGGGWRIDWASVPGKTYQLQASTSLSPAVWQDVGEPVLAIEALSTQLIGSTGTGPRFFRVVEK